MISVQISLSSISYSIGTENQQKEAYRARVWIAGCAILMMIATHVVEYAKSSRRISLIKLRLLIADLRRKILHLLPTLWFHPTLGLGMRNSEKPCLKGHETWRPSLVQLKPLISKRQMVVFKTNCYSKTETNNQKFIWVVQPMSR